MFILIFFIIVFLCFASMYLVSKILEIEKDINTLYDNYAKSLENIIANHLDKEV